MYHDYDLYHRNRQTIDRTILEMCEVGSNSAEIEKSLRAQGVGNARSDSNIELAYSTTGAAFRTGWLTNYLAGYVNFRAEPEEGTLLYLTVAGAAMLQKIREGRA